MNTYDWKEFLTEYSANLLKDPLLERRARIPEYARSSTWLGFPPAADQDIFDAEERLQIKLPPSLKAFYMVSNGWAVAGNFINSILPVEEIDWLRKLNPALFELLREDSRSVFQICDTIISKADVDVAANNYSSEEHGTLEERVSRSILVSGDSDGDVLILDAFAGDERGEWPGNIWNAWHPEENWNCDGFGGVFRQLRESYLSDPATD
ncbi:MAG: SMI1/KNR4 family protein [Pirellulaceae bacterium]|nr:SMI1/KNR4 family protein [Pirellulaceae bacterium]